MVSVTYYRNLSIFCINIVLQVLCLPTLSRKFYPLLSAKLDLLQEPKFFATKCSKKSETKTEVRRVRSTLPDSTTYIRVGRTIEHAYGILCTHKVCGC